MGLNESPSGVVPNGSAAGSRFDNARIDGRRTSGGRHPSEPANKSDEDRTLTPVAKFQRKYSDEQRAEFIRAVLDHGLSVPAAITAAARGDLEIPPFEMSRAVGYELVREARTEREQERLADPSAIADNISRIACRVVQLADRDLRQLEAEAQAGKPVQLNRLKTLAQVVRSLHGVGPRKTSQKPPPSERTTPAGGDFLERIAASDPEKADDETYDEAA
jgi:hypothetical protein